MTPENGNGGNGTKLKVEVHEATLEVMKNQIADMHTIMTTMFGADGVCQKERSKNAEFRAEVTHKRETIYTHIKGLWVIVTFIVASLVGIVIDFIKTGGSR